MKVLILLSLVCGVMLEAPYPASGWRPDGPAFDPTRGQQPYPFDPRNPNNLDGVDVSVQGLPTAEQQIFQLSPINGQQYSGPSVNADVAKLNPQLQQAQYQQQLQIAREFARQRELEAAARQANRQTYQAPGTFGQTTTAKPSRNPEETTVPFDLNEGETLDASRNQPEKVSVEITKQNIQEYPAELFLSPLTQLNQAQFVQLQQLGQLQNTPVIYQQIQAEPQGFDGPAHLAALPSVLAQRELFQQQQLSQNPIVVQQEAVAQPAPQYQLNQYQPIQPQIPVQQQIQPQYQPGQPQIQTAQYQPAQPQFQPGQPQFQPGQTQFQPGQPQIQTAFPVQPQFQPNPYQPTQPQFPVTPSGQYQPQVVFQPQSPKFQPANPDDVEEIETNQQQQPQFAYQFQQPNQQPQVYQPQFYQPNQQPIIVQPLDNQLIQFYQQQQNLETNQQGLQSGLDINQQGNDIEEKDRENDDTTTATAVATAFGTRTQPRVVAQYGVPSTVQRQPTPRYRTTTEAAQEEPATEDGPAIAEATAVANGSGRRNARLRSRRLRPVFTLDKSGHLVLAQNA
ncbi:mediator of RNA polymerase II transcription subunit 15-like isoform X2 [Aricia agestis]|uniref:mediator of RNA polymerase II transcription subunit 15-like isoform X2 n=1 Tax=Aricia agestis TaxID=91739 RepID=UPI001C2051CA|nr:mediator of RNA polymerase II transcription subunit 15-like isoform X2 [Aricia agestis]